MSGEFALTSGVLGRRCIAFAIDVVAIAALCLLAWVLFGLFGLLTLGLGLRAWALIPFFPFLYHFLTVAQMGATPGQQMMGICVRQWGSLAPPTYGQALISTLCFYLTLALGGWLLLLALITKAHRTLHDLAAGLVVIHANRLAGGFTGFEAPR